jgi:hypothetical protein
MNYRVCLLLLVATPSLHAAMKGTVFSGGGTAVENAQVAVYRRETPLEERDRLTAARERQALATATTDAQGAFTLDPKLQGIIDVRVTREGFAPWRKSVLADDGELAVDLIAAPARIGHVIADKKPVAGAIVLAGDTTGVLWSARTDEKGAFTIPDPKGWAQALRVTHPDFAPLVATPGASRSLEFTLTAGTSVHGKVVGANHRPVANARLFADRWPAGATKEDGTFVLAHVAESVKTIAAIAPSELGSARRSAGEIEIQLEAAHAISGNVRDAKERALQGARVTAWPMTANVTWEDAQTAITDEKGNYRIDSCIANDYRVGPEAADLTFEPANARLRTTRAASLNFTAKTRMFLEGIVVDDRKHPVAGAHVIMMPAQIPLIYAVISEGMGGGATTGGDGRFRLPMSETYAPEQAALRVQAMHPRYAGGAADLKRERGPVTITLHDGIEVRGHVADKDGKPVSGAGVALLEDPFGATVLPLDSLLSTEGGHAFVESDAAGAFTLHLNAAPYDLAVWKEGFAAFRLGAMTPVASQKPIEVVLDRGAEIHGHVVAKQPGTALAGTITAQSEIGFANAEVAADGTFVVGSLTPGKYTLEYEGAGGRTASKDATAPATDVVLEVAATSELRGRVTDKATGAVLREFSIDARLLAGDAASDNFDDVETFTLAVAAGVANVTARAPGYISETQQVTIEAEKPASVTFALARGRTISGRVTAGGVPVAGARLAINGDDDDESPVMAESSEDGEFALAGAPREPVTIEVEKQGFVSRKVDVDGDADRHVDIALSAGRKASGRVVTSTGDPVDGADVWAQSHGTDASSQQAKSSSDGTFTIEGLSDGRYSFQASRRDLGTAELKDVDPAAAAIVLTFPPSTGTGTVHGTVKGFLDRGWLYGSVSASQGDAQAIIRRDGTYRLENVRAGDVELRAYAMTNRDQVTSGPAKATIVANEDIEVDLAFRTDNVLRGTVTEGGQPAAGRTLSFSSNDSFAHTRTDEHGAYEMVGLEPGLYNVSAETAQRQSYATRYQMTTSATFDIAIAFSQLHGRTVDEAGAPIAGAEIEVKSDDENQRTVTSDAAGAFSANIAEAPAYVVTATKKGFATAVQSVDNTRTPVMLTLVRSAGLRVRLIDARDGRTLDGIVVASNAAGLIAGRASGHEKDGSFAVPLATGAYRVSVSATGYASQSVRISVPYEGELRLVLTPGGNLIVRTEQASSDLVKLVMPTGEEYVRCQCNGIAEIRLTGTTTTIDHVAPGTYTMQVLDAQERIKTTYPVTIVEGQTTVAEIHVPE